APTDDLVTDAQLDEYVRNHSETAYHPSCTCPMGEGNDSVVNGEGLVHGISGLRVVDASIMPNIISGNLNATTIMLAEKIVDKMRGVQLPRSTADYYT
ncbi:GMC oxidoreductase, partial [Pseudomonas sp. HY2-MNA-CIBAN-0224]